MVGELERERTPISGHFRRQVCLPFSGALPGCPLAAPAASSTHSPAARIAPIYSSKTRDGLGLGTSGHVRSDFGENWGRHWFHLLLPALGQPGLQQQQQHNAACVTRTRGPGAPTGSSAGGHLWGWNASPETQMWPPCPGSCRGRRPWGRWGCSPNGRLETKAREDK